MIIFNTVKSSHVTNEKGVMCCHFSQGFQNYIGKYGKIFIYKYDFNDLVEIVYKDNNFTVYHFFDGDKSRVDDLSLETNEIINKIYSANLYGERILYDLSLKEIVRYDDFNEVAEIPNLIDNEYFAFVNEKKSGYVHGISSVDVYGCTMNAPYIDKSILSFINSSYQVLKGSVIRLGGVASAVFISGLLAGLPIKDIIRDTDRADSNKFLYSVDRLHYDSGYVDSIFKSLKVDKFKRIVIKFSEDRKDNNDNTYLSLTWLLEVGLDYYLKGIKDQKKIQKIDLDCEQQSIRSAYIKDGKLHIVQGSFRDAKYFWDLFDSSNIIFINN